MLLIAIILGTDQVSPLPRLVSIVGKISDKMGDDKSNFPKSVVTLFSTSQKHPVNPLTVATAHRPISNHTLNNTSSEPGWNRLYSIEWWCIEDVVIYAISVAVWFVGSGRQEARRPVCQNPTLTRCFLRQSSFSVAETVRKWKSFGH